MGERERAHWKEGCKEELRKEEKTWELVLSGRTRNAMAPSKLLDGKEKDATKKRQKDLFLSRISWLLRMSTYLCRQSLDKNTAWWREQLIPTNVIIFHEQSGLWQKKGCFQFKFFPRQWPAPFYGRPHFRKTLSPQKPYKIVSFFFTKIGRPAFAGNPFFSNWKRGKTFVGQDLHWARCRW